MTRGTTVVPAYESTSVVGCSSKKVIEMDGPDDRRLYETRQLIGPESACDTSMQLSVNLGSIFPVLFPISPSLECRQFYPFGAQYLGR
jgi:hypothetical protein